MAKGDLFKRSLEAGTSFLDMTRERAETIVKEWVDAGDLGKSRAQKAVEQVLERSRKASDDLRALVRKEIGEQLGAMGVATKDDVARLEAKVAAATGTAGPGVADAPPSPQTGVSTAAAEAAAKTGGRPKKAGAPRKTSAARPAPAKKATAAGGAKKAATAGPAAAKKATVPRKAPRKAVPRPGAGPRPGT